MLALTILQKGGAMPNSYSKADRQLPILLCRTIVISLLDPQDATRQIAALLAPFVDPQYHFTTWTVGLGVQCTPVNPLSCNVSTPYQAMPGVTFDCSDAGFPYMIYESRSVWSNDAAPGIDPVSVENDQAILNIPQITTTTTNPLPVWAKLVYATDHLVEPVDSKSATVLVKPFLNFFADFWQISHL
jgi:hypothetical protein